jgi:UDPglucose 6-dehydrogenase
MELMRAVQEVNQIQRHRIVRTIAEGLGGISGRRIAVLGLAFKPGTNDLRDSPGLELGRELVVAGATVVA